MTFIPLASGTILTFAGIVVPNGWLACDGTAYNQADYPDLYATLGSTYNTQTNPTTGAAWTAPSASQFRVPDYRGTFLRGVGTPSGLDAVTLGGFQSQKTKPNGLAGTAAGQTLGSTGVAMASGVTTSTNIDHTHAQAVTDTYYLGGTGVRRDSVSTNTGGQTVAPYAQGISTGGMNNNTTHAHSWGAVGTTNIAHTHLASSLSITGDNETTPINLGVTHIIKI